MTALPAKRETRVFAIAENGSSVPFSGSRVRIMIARASWLDVDLEIDRHAPVVVTVGARARDERRTNSPYLTLRPWAGNVVSVIAHLDELLHPDAWALLAAHAPRLEGPDAYRPIAGRALRIEYGDVATIELQLGKSEDALPSLMMDAVALCDAEPGTPFPSLRMSLVPHACNLVSFWFHEVAAARPR